MGRRCGAALFIGASAYRGFEMFGETIVAIATPEGSGGLAVVRLSGADAVVIANRVFSPGIGSNSDSHRAVYGILSTPKDNKNKNRQE